MYPRSSAMVLRSKKPVSVSLVVVGSPRVPGGEVDSAEEVFVKLSVDTKAGANAGTIAIGYPLLKKVLAADAHVAGETEPAEGRLKR